MGKLKTGNASVTNDAIMNKTFIDTNKEPFCPNSLTIETHKKGGEIDLGECSLYLSEKQKNWYITGTELQRELEDKNPLNACVLDYLLEHTDLIPDIWKDKYIFFWGTIYRHPYGFLCVRSLYWDGESWYWNSFWLGDGWCGSGPALTLNSLLEKKQKIGMSGGMRWGRPHIRSFFSWF